MIGPGDSNLMAKAIASRSGEKNNSATADNEMSTTLFKIKPLTGMVPSRDALLPRPTAFSNRSFRLSPDEREFGLFVKDSRGDACAPEFANSTLFWRTACPCDELCRPKACDRWYREL